MNCNNECSRLAISYGEYIKETAGASVQKWHYLNGYKRCRNCNKMFKTDDIFCVCCNQRLSTRSCNKHRKMTK